MWETLITSTLTVLLAELGDKTQLLALLLAARFHKTLPIVLGILVATVFNHTLAGLLGAWISTQLSPETLHWIIAVGFWAMAAWILIPDKEDGDLLSNPWITKSGVFITTLVAFFLAEMGDKTQIATIALAAHFENAFWVVSGTTIGMLLADVPAVYLGDFAAEKLPLKGLRYACAPLFVVLGLVAVFQN